MLDVETFFKRFLDALTKTSRFSMNSIYELLLKAKGDNAKIYLELGCSIAVCAGATLKFGFEDELEIQSTKQKFKMYEIGGKFAVYGVSAGAGYFNTEKTNVHNRELSDAIKLINNLDARF